MLDTMLNGKAISVNASAEMTLLFALDNDTGAHPTVPGVGRARMRRIRFTLDRGSGGKR